MSAEGAGSEVPAVQRGVGWGGGGSVIVAKTRAAGHGCLLPPDQHAPLQLVTQVHANCVDKLLVSCMLCVLLYEQDTDCLQSQGVIKSAACLRARYPWSGSSCCRKVGSNGGDSSSSRPLPVCRTFSSMLFSVQKRKTCTSFFWPIR